MVRKRKAEVACRFYAKYGSCNDPHCALEHQDTEPRREDHGWHGSWGQKGEGLQDVEFEATEPHVYRFVQESSSVNSSSDENLQVTMRTPVQQNRVEEIQELEGADVSVVMENAHEYDVADWTSVLPALPNNFLKRPRELCDLPIVYTLGADPWDRSVAAKEFIAGLADDVCFSHEYRCRKIPDASFFFGPEFITENTLPEEMYLAVKPEFMIWPAAISCTPEPCRSF